MQWLSSHLHHSRRSAAARRRTGSLRLEALEERRLFSTLTVTNLHDGGAGSLRANIAAAQSGDTIVFSPTIPLPNSITLSSGELLLTRNLNIRGPSTSQLTISANDTSRVFKVATGATVALSSLTISRGWGAPSGGYGGGILNNGTLTVSNCTAFNNGAIYGAGICNLGGNLTVSNCTLSANYATGLAGGGIYNAGGNVTVNNTTFVNNNSHFGGAIYNTGGSLTLSNSTLTNNWVRPAYNGGGGLGGALYNTAGTVTISNSTLSGNISYIGTLNGGGGGIYNAPDGTVVVKNFSSITGNTCSFEGESAPEDVNNLGRLYRDSTSTIGVLVGNPALALPIRALRFDSQVTQ